MSSIRVASSGDQVAHGLSKPTSLGLDFSLYWCLLSLFPASPQAPRAVALGRNGDHPQAPVQGN